MTPGAHFARNFRTFSGILRDQLLRVCAGISTDFQAGSDFARNFRRISRNSCVLNQRECRSLNACRRGDTRGGFRAGFCARFFRGRFRRRVWSGSCTDCAHRCTENAHVRIQHQGPPSLTPISDARVRICAQVFRGTDFAQNFARIFAAGLGFRRTRSSTSARGSLDSRSRIQFGFNARSAISLTFNHPLCTRCSRPPASGY